MEKQIVVKERVRKLGGEAYMDAIQTAKTTTLKKTSFGVRIKRIANLLILL